MENEVVETDETRTEKEPENATEGATHDSQPTEEVCFVETADAVKDCDLKNPDDTNKPPQCATNDDWLAEAPVRGKYHRPKRRMLDWMVKADSKSRDRNGNTRLHLACYNGNTSEVHSWVKSGDEVNETNNTGETPLHSTCYFSHSGIAQHLIKHGADVNATDIWGDTPLHVATHNNLPNMVKLLLHAGADRKLQNLRGQTAADKINPYWNKSVAEVEHLFNKTGAKKLIPSDKKVITKTDKKKSKSSNKKVVTNGDTTKPILSNKKVATKKVGTEQSETDNKVDTTKADEVFDYPEFVYSEIFQVLAEFVGDKELKYDILAKHILKGFDKQVVDEMLMKLALVSPHVSERTYVLLSQWLLQTGRSPLRVKFLQMAVDGVLSEEAHYIHRCIESIVWQNCINGMGTGTDSRLTFESHQTFQNDINIQESNSSMHQNDCHKDAAKMADKYDLQMKDTKTGDDVTRKNIEPHPEEDSCCQTENKEKRCCNQEKSEVPITSSASDSQVSPGDTKSDNPSGASKTSRDTDVGLNKCLIVEDVQEYILHKPDTEWTYCTTVEVPTYVSDSAKTEEEGNISHQGDLDIQDMDRLVAHVDALQGHIRTDLLVIKSKVNDMAENINQSKKEDPEAYCEDLLQVISSIKKQLESDFENMKNVILRNVNRLDPFRRSERYDNHDEYVCHKIFCLIAECLKSRQYFFEQFVKCLFFGFPQTMIDATLKVLQKQGSLFNRVYDALMMWKMTIANFEGRLVQLHRVIRAIMPRKEQEIKAGISKIVKQYKKCSDKGLNHAHIIYVAKNLGDEWSDLGRILDFSPVELQVLQMRNQQDEVKRNSDMLHIWRQKKCCQSNLERGRLIMALASVGRFDVSTNL